VRKNGKKRNKMIIEPSVSESSTQSAPHELSKVNPQSRVLKILVDLPPRAFAAIKNFAMPHLKKLKNVKGVEKFFHRESAPVETQPDLDFENWLASITEKSNKKLSPPKSVSVVKKSSKK
jgi:hypothetical protein